MAVAAIAARRYDLLPGGIVASTKSVSASHTSVATSIRAYLAALPPVARRALTCIRSAIRTAAPDATEVFSYGMPGFRAHGRPLIYYAAWKAHVSLYPISAATRRAFAAEMVGASDAKGTARFPLNAPPSAPLVARLTAARFAEIARRTPASAKKTSAAKRSRA